MPQHPHNLALLWVHVVGFSSSSIARRRGRGQCAGRKCPSPAGHDGLVEMGCERGSCGVVVACRRPRPASRRGTCGWGTAGVSPVLFCGPEGPRHASLYATAGPAVQGNSGPEGPSSLTPRPRGPRLHGWHSLPKCPGTFLRAGYERGTRPRALRVFAPKRVLAVPHLLRKGLRDLQFPMMPSWWARSTRTSSGHHIAGAVEARVTSTRLCTPPRGYFPADHVARIPGAFTVSILGMPLLYDCIPSVIRI